MMMGASPKGRRSAPPKLAQAPLSGVDGNGPKRFSVQRKMAIVARLLRGEPLELVARETNVSIARPTEWRDRALAGAGTRNWQTTSAGTSPPPAFTARATASYGRDCASRGFAQVPGVCDG